MGLFANLVSMQEEPCLALVELWAGVTTTPPNRHYQELDLNKPSPMDIHSPVLVGPEQLVSDALPPKPVENVAPAAARAGRITAAFCKLLFAYFLNLHQVQDFLGGRLRAKRTKLQA
jgi:hypothetical protein